MHFKKIGKPAPFTLCANGAILFRNIGEAQHFHIYLVSNITFHLYEKVVRTKQIVWWITGNQSYWDHKNSPYSAEKRTLLL